MTKNNHISIKYFALLVFTSFILFSCNKLDETPKSFVAPQNYWNTVTQCEATYAASLSYIWKPWSTGYAYFANYQFANDDHLFGGNLNFSSGWGQDLWGNHFKSIKEVNGVLRAVKEGSLNGLPQADINNVIGQGEFIRAYNYFTLVRLWGPVPVYNSESPEAYANPLPRAPLQEVYAQIVKDLTSAANFLPAAWPTGQKAKPTKGTAMGLLAKVYLTMATNPLNATDNYAKAAAAAKTVIDGGAHSLIANIGDVFKSENKFASEMLFSFQSNSTDFVTHSELWMPGALGGWGDFSVETGFEINWPNQSRKSAYLITDVNGLHYDEGGYGYPPRPSNAKFIIPNIPATDLGVGSSANMPVLRYADVLLIYAEAASQAAGGPTQEACDAANKVIARANGYIGVAGHPFLTTTMTKDAFDKAIIQERSWELCFEFDRYFDILRKKLLLEINRGGNGESNFSEDDYLWPIPQLDMLENPLLKPNNPGYPTP